MSGNVTKEGIKADLEWMKRVGIAGFQNFDAGLETPQIVEKRLVYMTPEWKDAFKYAATLADQLSLEMAIAGSPGWSESGGPWVTPAQAMKKYVWSETRVEGGRPFSGALPQAARRRPATTRTSPGGIGDTSKARRPRRPSFMPTPPWSPIGRPPATGLGRARREADLERRDLRPRGPHRRRPGQGQPPAGGARGRESLGRVRIPETPNDSRAHLHDGHGRPPGAPPPVRNWRRATTAANSGRSRRSRPAPERSLSRRLAQVFQGQRSSPPSPGPRAPAALRLPDSTGFRGNTDRRTGPSHLAHREPVPGKGGLLGRHRAL